MEKIETIRHSLSHIMAYAVQEIYPAASKDEPRLQRGTKFGIGPAIESGFYYDFDLPCPITPTDLPKIEKKMREIIKKNLMFERKKMKITEAIKFFKKLGQPYKVELLDEMKKKKTLQVTSYKLQDFIDLCKGPHIKSTKEIPADGFKLTKIAGAYWRGDEKNKMLTRIYGVAFGSKKELDKYLKLQEEAEKRDHRVLGQKLELFIFDDEIGAGLPLWMPKGAVLRHIIENYLYQELISVGYQWVVTPHIANLNLWKTSGHWNFYRENMYSPIKIDEEEYMLKPMNCPFHVKIYKSQTRSYRDLPLRYAELGTVYRYERSGVLHGLTRVRGFTQDDAHIICAPEQLSEELTKTVKHGLEMLKTFGFKESDIYLSTRPEKYAGTIIGWEKATKTLKFVLNKLGLKYKVDEGGGVFYGPKIDIKIKDSLGRDWQCTTVQFDFNLPEKFKMTYIDQKGKKQEPYMIHRALLGSMERFIGVLIEHYAGAFPFWLAPVQIWIIPLGSRHEKYAQEVAKKIREISGKFVQIREEVRDENETVSKKIREGEIQKIPYLLVVGDKEMESQSVRVRSKNKDLGMIKLEKFIDKIKKEIEEKEINKFYAGIIRKN